MVGFSHAPRKGGLALPREVYRLDGDGYRLVVTRGGTDRVRLEPFGAIEIELEALWPTPPTEAK